MSPEQGAPGRDPASGQQPTEEELRAAYEEELRNLRVEHVLLENVVAMVNLGMRRTGLAPGTEGERDASQVRLAVESIRALMPVLEQAAPEQVGQIRGALSQLQLAFVKIGEQHQAQGPDEASASDSKPSSAEPSTPGEPGPAQRSGRLWVPGQ
jgi:hypothetical protein